MVNNLLQRLPKDLLHKDLSDEAIALGGQHIPRTIRTIGGFNRALELQGRYNDAIRSLELYSENPNINPILGELKTKRGYLKSAIDHYLFRIANEQ